MNKLLISAVLIAATVATGLMRADAARPAKLSEQERHAAYYLCLSHASDNNPKPYAHSRNLENCRTIIAAN